jgi:stringent starvation protein B
MTLLNASGNNGSSTRPYLIRALHEWCTENGFTPYIAVFVDSSVRVPQEYVKNNEIVLNVGFEATSALQLGNELIEFRARFGGSSRQIVVPVTHVIAIYARENGQGMAFPAPTIEATETTASDVAVHRPETKRAPAGGPHLSLAEGATVATAEPARPAGAPPAGDDGSEGPPDPPAPGRPALKRVK